MIASLVFCTYFYFFFVKSKETTTLYLNQDFTENPLLGRDLSVIVVVKDFFQMLKTESTIEKTKRNEFSIGSTEIGPLENGVLLGIKLDKDIMSFEDSKWQKISMYPAGLDFFGKRMLSSRSSDFEEIDLETGVRKVHKNGWFRHIHTLQYNHDGTKVLVTSSGFDMIIEYDLIEEKNTWEWCGYDHGFTINAMGLPITRDPIKAERLLKVSPERVFVDPSHPSMVVGLPTKRRCCHISGAFYQTNDTIGALFAHQHMISLVSQENDDLQVMYDGLLNFPHGFNHQNNEIPCKGYIVSDSRRGEIVFFDEDFEPCMRLNVVTGIPSLWFDTDKYIRTLLPVVVKQAEWLQFVTHLTGDIYSAVDVKRRHILLIDMSKREYRVIPYSQYIAIQEVRYEPPELSDLLIKTFSLIKPKKEEEETTTTTTTTTGIKILKKKNERVKEMKRILKFPRVILSPNEIKEFRKLCKGEEYYPLKGFMTEEEFNCVLTEKSLCDGSKFWDIDDPSSYEEEDDDDVGRKKLERKTVIKPITDEESKLIKEGDEVVLYGERTLKGKKKVVVLGSMIVESKYNHNRNRHSFMLYGKTKNVVNIDSFKEEKEENNGIGAEYHFDRRLKDIFDIGPVDLIGGRIVACHM